MYPPKWLKEPKCWASETQPAKDSLLVAGTERDSVYSSSPGADNQLLGTEKQIVDDFSLSHFQENFSECPE